MAIVDIPPDFDWTRRTSFVEIVKVSRDTMNYSCRGDAKLRETFLRRGELTVCVRVPATAIRVLSMYEGTCMCVSVCIVRVCDNTYSLKSTVSLKGYEGPDRGMNAGKHRIIENVEGEGESSQEREEGLKRDCKNEFIVTEYVLNEENIRGKGVDSLLNIFLKNIISSIWTLFVLELNIE